MIFSCSCLGNGAGLEGVMGRDFPVLVDFNEFQFRQLGLAFQQGNIPVDPIRCVRLSRFPVFELRELGTPCKEIVVGFLQIELRVGECQTVHFPKPWKFLFIVGRSRELLFFQYFFILFELIVGIFPFLQHFIVDKTDAAKGFGQQDFLCRCRVQTEFVCLVCYVLPSPLTECF